MENREHVIQYLMQHRRELQAKRDKLVQGIELEIEHVSATIDSLQKSRIQVSSGPSTPTLQQALLDFNAARLRGLTQTQAIEAIAMSNGGFVKAQEAKRLMIKAGIMKPTKNATNMTYSVIRRSDLFERVGPGKYRLKGFKQADEGEGNQATKQLTQ